MFYYSISLIFLKNTVCIASLNLEAIFWCFLGLAIMNFSHQSCYLCIAWISLLRMLYDSKASCPNVNSLPLFFDLLHFYNVIFVEIVVFEYVQIVIFDWSLKLIRSIPNLCVNTRGAQEILDIYNLWRIFGTDLGKNG